MYFLKNYNIFVPISFIIISLSLYNVLRSVPSSYWFSLLIVCVFWMIWTIDFQYHFVILLTLSVRNVNCTFEDHFRCGYQITSDGEFSWYQHRASTPSKLTGPDLDYTRKSPEGKTQTLCNLSFFFLCKFALSLSSTVITDVGVCDACLRSLWEVVRSLQY